jgi:hypothetical protein
MSDYLNSLVARTLRLGPVVQPRPASLFEPVAAGPINEAAFAVTETRSTQEIASPTQRVAGELSDMPVQKRVDVAANESAHVVLQSQTIPTTLPPASLPPSQVVPPSPFTVNATERTREVRGEELPPRSVDSDWITPASETRHNPTPSLIRPEVRIIRSATDREPIQPSLTTPPLAPVVPYTARPDSLSRTRNVSAQAAEPAEAPETVIVTIGRVDVRAIFAPPQAVPRTTRTQPQPLSLDEYLKQRSEGRR